MTDPAPPCPNDLPVDGSETERRVCGGEVERQISLSSFQLKGGGWADTGYS